MDGFPAIVPGPRDEHLCDGCPFLKVRKHGDFTRTATCTIFGQALPILYPTAADILKAHPKEPFRDDHFRRLDGCKESERQSRHVSNPTNDPTTPAPEPDGAESLALVPPSLLAWWIWHRINGYFDPKMVTGFIEEAISIGPERLAKTLSKTYSNFKEAEHVEG